MRPRGPRGRPPGARDLRRSIGQRALGNAQRRLARRQFLSTFLERCETGVEVAPNRDELRLALGEAAFDLGGALHRRREALSQLRQLPLTCDRGLRHHLLEPADHRLPLAARLLTLGQRCSPLRLGQRLLAGAKVFGVRAQLFESATAVGDLRLGGF